MTDVQFYRGFDMSGSDIVKYSGGDIDNQTTSSEHLSHGKYAGLIAGDLNFYQTDTGQVTSFSGQYRQHDVLLITGFSENNNQFASARHDADQFYKLLLSGNDKITGSEFADVLDGHDGRDLLRGGDGDDVLIGGQGADHLTGGVGHDSFKFEQSTDSTVTDRDLITDYNSADNVDLTAFGLSSTDGIRTTYSQAKDRTIVHVDTNGDHHADLVFALNGAHQSDIDFVI